MADPREITGHDFRNPDLLHEALTHPSVLGERGRDRHHPKKRKPGDGFGYERLEFLGDRVLGLVIAQMLLDAFPDEAEGKIALRHTALVRESALARVATEIGLGEYLYLSKSENLTGGREKDPILADAMEAVIAALYLDGGLEVARDFISRHWSGLLNEYEAPPQDPKTALQEWAQARSYPLPDYTLVSQTGPAHDPEFEVSVSVEGAAPVKARANSKRRAEKKAAQELLDNLKGRRDG